MWPAIWLLLSRLVDAEKLGGYTRALVAALIGMLINRWPLLASIATPEVQAVIAAAAAAFVVGIWSQIAKAMTSDVTKINAVAELPDVRKVIVSDPKLARDTPSPKVTNG